MGMERRGLVAYVEAQIERDIALGRIHPSGRFGSEAKLARRYEVCRGTIREALRRLAARGLVVQRPGRKTRAVPLDESLTLENLGLALHDASNPDARWLLEGYFSLKRQVLVELLADCCARASDLDLDRLGSTCYRLQDAARWESGETCARAEFELLRQAARVAARPGHVLLVQSLQRAFLGGAAQLLPLMGGEALREWAFRVMEILNERDVQALQHELPALLKARDERVLNAFAPAPQEPASPAAPRAQEGPLGTTVQDKAPAAHPCVEEHGIGRSGSAAEQDESLEALPGVQRCGLCRLSPTDLQDDSLEAPPPCVGAPAHLVQDVKDTEALAVPAGPQVAAPAVKPDNRSLPFPTPLMFAPCELDLACIDEDMTGAGPGNLSGCRTGSNASSPEEGIQPEPPHSDRGEQTRVTAHTVNGPLHVIQGLLVRWAARLWRSLISGPSPGS
ncbi:GntR family transcriptional regulator [Corallococcus exiguus]|uniref:FadR/GntR family transcriptional regulator n=1 Tax=Corallococcus TaxID=83461 RepID=UPI000EE92421|nr:MULTISPECIES: GntR family transcriptional regulator [Corallococcus]NNC02554.1 GntR family transcriptional regulator [Corallococcus exiguus]NPC49145.1 GntR family transcriptional regulator [Corallococcus exiguus]RKH78078.1 GntR family transcriptional regulator [Corallococcus sp. AB032C]